MNRSVRRILAFATDWLIVALWGGVLFAAVMLATGGNLPQQGNPWTAEGIGFLSMTLPVTLYFGIFESSRWRASIGKRLLGLEVSRQTGERLSFGRAVLRNAIKFVPWEFGHLVAQQAISAGDGGFPAWLRGPAIVAVGVPLWWLVSLIATGRTPYDRWTDVQVVHSADLEPRSVDMVGEE